MGEVRRAVLPPPRDDSRQDSPKFPLTFIRNETKDKPIRHVMGWMVAGIVPGEII